MALVEQPASPSQEMHKPLAAEKSRSPSLRGEELVRSIVSVPRSESGEDHQYDICGCRLTGNVIVLVLTTFLFGLITAVQYYFGGVVTHSQALLADCNCMLVDTLTYFINIWAELAPVGMRRKLQLTAPILSLSVLTGLTIYIVLGAITTIKEGGDEDEVGPWIVWIFGFVGLIFDTISIIAFCCNRREQRQQGLPVNMLAAFVHVGADFIRSLTTSVEGVFLLSNFPPGLNGSLVDAWSCVVITVVILIGILYGIYEIAVDIRKYMETGA